MFWTYIAALPGDYNSSRDDMKPWRAIGEERAQRFIDALSASAPKHRCECRNCGAPTVHGQMSCSYCGSEVCE